MKRILISAIALILASASICAQNNVAYINTKTILESIPSYVSGQNEIQALSQQYEETIKTEISKIENLYNNYQASKASLTASQRASVENQIISKENAVQEKQELYFGEDGIIAKKSETLLAPIRKKMEEAISAVGLSMGYSMIIDVAMTPGVVYYNKDQEISQQIINILNK